MEVRISPVGYIQIKQKEVLANALEAYEFARIYIDKEGQNLKIQFLENDEEGAYSTKPARPEVFSKKIQIKQLRNTPLVKKVLTLEYIEKGVFATATGIQWAELEKDKKPNPYNKPASWSVGKDCLYLSPLFVLEHGLEGYDTCNVFFRGGAALIGFAKNKGRYHLKRKGKAAVIQFHSKYEEQLGSIKTLEILKED